MKTLFMAGVGLVVSCLLMLIFSHTYFSWINSESGLSTLKHLAEYSNLQVDNPSRVDPALFQEVAHIAFYGLCLGAGVVIGMAITYLTYYGMVLFSLACIGYLLKELIGFIITPLVILLVAYIAINTFTGNKLHNAIKAYFAPGITMVTETWATMKAWLVRTPAKANAS